MPVEPGVGSAGAGWGSRGGSADAGGGLRRVAGDSEEPAGAGEFAPPALGSAAAYGERAGGGCGPSAGSGEAAAGSGCARVSDPAQRGAPRPPLAVRRAVTGGPGPAPGVSALRRGLPAGRTAGSLGACGAWQMRGETAPGRPRRRPPRAGSSERLSPAAPVVIFYFSLGLCIV